MTKEQFDKLYVGKKLVVHCDTEEKAKELLALADGFGYTWCGGSKRYTEHTYWNNHKEDTCYFLYYGVFSRIGYFEKENFTIVTYPAHKKEFTKSDLEDGYKVVYRSGDERFVLVRTQTLHYKNGDMVKSLKTYNDGLICIRVDSDSIVKVYDRNDNLIWERIEQPDKTPQEIELEELEAKAEKAKAEIQEISDRIRKLRGE